MPLEPDFELALRSSAPVEGLRSLAARLLAEGHDRQHVVDVFEDARRRLRTEDREADEDAVLDVLDVLVDWCSPHMRLQESEIEATRHTGHAQVVSPPLQE